MSEHCIVNSLFPGDIVFDVGANAGDKTDVFQKRGVRVICVEPQPLMIQVLNNRFEGNNNVEVVATALGSNIGELPMNICSESPVLSTLSETWKKGRFVESNWDSTVVVPVTTLDKLVEQYGVPRYIKIDVEGFEKQVISGLSSRVGLISFEFTSEYIRDAFESIGQLVKLGYTQFNISIGEQDVFALPNWIPFFDLIPILTQNCQQQPLLWGDIYAN